MAEEVKPVHAPVWDRRTISSIRRELEKSFEALVSAYDRAKEEKTEEAQDEATKLANQFYDLYETRCNEYEACEIEASPQAEEAGNHLVTDFSRYKETLEKHHETGRTSHVEDVDALLDGSVDDISPSGRLEFSLLNKSKAEEKEEKGETPPAPNKTMPPKAAPTASILNSMKKKMSSTMSAGRRALDTIVGGQTPEQPLTPEAVLVPEKEPPHPHPPQQPVNVQTPEPVAAMNQQGTIPTTDGWKVSAQVQEDAGKGDATGSSTRPPLPPGFQRYEDERRMEADVKKGPGAVSKNSKPAFIVSPPAEATPEDTKSTTSSRKSSRKGSRGRSKVSSVLSEQIDKEMQENMQLEDARLEENEAHADAELELLYSQIKDVKMQKKLDKQLHEKKIENIKQNAAELHAIVDASEEESQSETSSVVVVGDRTKEACDNLEMTAAGAAFGGERPDAMMREWAKGAAKMTSTTRKDVKPQMTFSLPKKALPDAARKTSKKIDFGTTTKEEKKEKRPPPSLPFRAWKDVKPKKEKKKQPEVKVEDKKKVENKKQEAKADAGNAHSRQFSAAAASKRSPSSSSCSSTSSTTSSTASASWKSDVSSRTTNVMAAVVRLQQKQLEASLRQVALNQLKEARPNKKFSGATNKRMDFAKHMKLFKEAMEIPGVSKKQMLNEFQHWFEGSAFKLIEAETLKHAESAVDEAVDRLTRKFGMRQDTALEMLDEVLQGKAIGAKDHNGLLDFYAKLVSIHSLACETDKGNDFENKLVVKTIIEKKLPHMKDKWTRKAVKYKLAHKSEMKFAQFLEYIDEEHIISEMMSRYNDGANQNKPVANAKVSATSVNTAAKREGSSAPTPKTAPGNCPRCDAAHKLDECPVFRELNSTDRRKFTKNQNLCFRCLQSGHMAKACESTISCDKCDIPHHPLTHPTPGGNRQLNNDAAGAPTEEKNA